METDQKGPKTAEKETQLTIMVLAFLLGRKQRGKADTFQTPRHEILCIRIELNIRKDEKKGERFLRQ